MGPGWAVARRCVPGRRQGSSVSPIGWSTLSSHQSEIEAFEITKTRSLPCSLCPIPGYRLRARTPRRGSHHPSPPGPGCAVAGPRAPARPMSWLGALLPIRHRRSRCLHPPRRALHARPQRQACAQRRSPQPVPGGPPGKNPNSSALTVFCTIFGE